MSRVGPDVFSPKLPTGAGHRLDHLPGPLGPLVATDIGLGGNLFFRLFGVIKAGQQTCSRWWIFVLKT